MSERFKQLTGFFRDLGADGVEHTGKNYLAHVIGVYNDLKSWGCDEDVCVGGMFHSVYGTERFQRFSYPFEGRAKVAELIGERAERIAFFNSAMDRSFFDDSILRFAPPHRWRSRLDGEVVELSKAAFIDLCTVYLCDWLEQVPRSQEWDYRRDVYHRIAEELGGPARAAFETVYAQSAEAAS